jgi:putative sterol carrier protein
MTKERILEELRKLREAFEDPELQSKFKNYRKTIQFTFPDIDADMFMQIGNGTIDAIGVGIAEADLGVTVDSSVFLGILDKTEDPLEAYSTGKLKTRGEVHDLIVLRNLLF